MHGHAVSVPIEQIGNGDDFRVDSGDIQGLAESMRRNGLLQPIGLCLVTPEGHEAHFRCIWGRRRIAAARLNGWTDIAAMVFDGLRVGDKEIATMRLMENTIRQNYKPLEEAKAVLDALSQGETDTGLAERTGMSLSWVRRRARVADRLCPDLQDEVNEGKLDIDIAEVLARLDGAKAQKHLLAVARQEMRWKTEGLTAAGLRKIMAAQCLRLAQAPFDRTDCESCPRRTDAQAQLGMFSEMTDLDKSARCLDQTCWASKAKAAADTIGRNLREAGWPKVAIVDAKIAHQAPGKYTGQPAWQELKKVGGEFATRLDSLSKAKQEVLQGNSLVRALAIEQDTGAIFLVFKNDVEAKAALAGAKMKGNGKGGNGEDESPATPKTDRFYQSLQANRDAAAREAKCKAYRSHEPDRATMLRLAAFDSVLRADGELCEWFADMTGKGEGEKAENPFSTSHYNDRKEGENQQRLWELLCSLDEATLVRIIGYQACAVLEKDWRAGYIRDVFFEAMVPNAEIRKKMIADATAEYETRMEKRKANLAKAASKVKAAKKAEKPAAKAEAKKPAKRSKAKQADQAQPEAEA